MLIYLIRNEITQKVYIGQTHSYSLSKRWNARLSNARSNVHLEAAIRLYGHHVFSRRILCYASCQQELDLLEKFWIVFFRSNDPKFGYNQQEGGVHWRGRHSTETRQRISESCRRWWTPARRKARSIMLRQIWRHRTEKRRALIAARVSQAITGRKRADQVWNKGKSGPRYGKGIPKTREHRRKISAALKLTYQLRKINDC